VETNDFFKSEVAKDAITVATFSAPWCGSCKQVKPTIEKLAEELAGKAVR
jgi:thiol-disulfide isomerase/thioredoxin